MKNGFNNVKTLLETCIQDAMFKANIFMALFDVLNLHWYICTAVTYYTKEIPSLDFFQAFSFRITFFYVGRCSQDIHQDTNYRDVFDVIIATFMVMNSMKKYFFVKNYRQFSYPCVCADRAIFIITMMLPFLPSSQTMRNRKGWWWDVLLDSHASPHTGNVPYCLCNCRLLTDIDGFNG